MKLQTRFLLSLIIALIVSFGLTQVLQNYQNHVLMEKLSSESMQAEEQAYLEIVENLRKASDASLRDAMMEGDMEKFRKLLEGQREISTLKEMSLINYKGVITYSTTASQIKKPLAADLAGVLLKNPAVLQRRTPEGLEIYHPMKAAECMECHKEFKDVPIGGIFMYRYSTQSLDEASSRWSGFVDTMTLSSVKLSALTALVLLVILGGCVLYLVRRQIAAPLDAINQALAAGAVEVGNAAANIAGTSRALAEGSSQQAASTEEASASLEEMTAMTKRNAEDAAQARGMAQEARQAAESGVASVNQMSTTMREISVASARMSSTLKIIDEISFQTNILALNAAVEAARAGEAGAGFAVVAEEVRNLALRSAEAAKEISSMVNEALEKIRKGEALGEQVRVQLEDIRAKTNKEAELIEQIARASEEQRQGTVQITEAVHQIDSVTQKNTATSEESSAMAQQLNSHAQSLKEDVENLARLVYGDRK
jgi:hypothetical protein